MYAFLVLVGIMGLWSLWGFASSRVERARYAVVSSKKGYEVRRYPEHIVARTVVRGPYREALGQGFRIVAGYIFGGNSTKEGIAMTAPVTVRGKGVAIAMTAPVLAGTEGDERVISFGMPRSYTLATLPVPNDPRVEIAAVPERDVAVLRFSGFRTEARVQAKKRELLDALKADGVATVGEPQYAGYDAPWTPPWMTRHEILIQIG